MAPLADSAAILSRMEEFFLAPVQHPDLLPTVIPLILGAFVIELYFGKHKTEVLGWNSSVANSIIWVSTGLNLLLTESFTGALERYVTYLILGIGIVVGYMDFFHKWSEAVAFRASSADVTYPLAYVTVVIVKTGVPVNETTIKAAAGFILGVVVFFHILRGLETPSPEDIMGDFQA